MPDCPGESRTRNVALRRPSSPSTMVPASSTRRPGPSLSTRSEEHTSELQSRQYLVCRLLLAKTQLSYYDCEPNRLSLRPVTPRLYVPYYHPRLLPLHLASGRVYPFLSLRTISRFTCLTALVF